MFAIRISKTLCVLAIAFFASLAALGNITDYATNFAFIKHIFLMDAIPPGSSIIYRSISSEWIHYAGYDLIIALESITALLCGIGGVRMALAARKDHKSFSRAKLWGVAGLTLGFLTWHMAFMSIGGEWFGMWMAGEWNGVPSAFRFLTSILLVLIYISIPNDTAPYTMD